MSKPIIRTYSRITHTVVKLLGLQIREARIEQKRTAQDVAERAGISRGLLQRIEKGEMGCEIGVVFEVANILGIQLFNSETTALNQLTRQKEEKLTLLPKSVRKIKQEIDDDF